MSSAAGISVRNTVESDFDGIIRLTQRVYPQVRPWSQVQLRSHLAIFPEGQFVAVSGADIVGMAASLIVLWDHFDFAMTWKDFTADGMFTTHDPARGHTLYGAEVMVDPSTQGRGIGSLLYDARRSLTERLGLLRIRAGARLRGYHRHADRLTPEQYVEKVVSGDLVDPTLTFQLRRGFVVLAVATGYLRHDPESLGCAAVIEWKNPRVPG